jgi:hypothetical protein
VPALQTMQSALVPAVAPTSVLKEPAGQAVAAAPLAPKKPACARQSVCSLRPSKLAVGETVFVGQSEHAAAAPRLKLFAAQSVQSASVPAVAPTSVLKEPAGQAVAAAPLAP